MRNDPGQMVIAVSSGGGISGTGALRRDTESPRSAGTSKTTQ